MRISLIIFVIAILAACAESADTTFDPSAPDASSDVKADSTICNLSTCPTPPGGSQKCCAGMNICGYMAGNICYTMKDSGIGGSGGGG